MSSSKKRTLGIGQLSDADSMCDGAPSFTMEERAKIKAYQPDDKAHQYGKYFKRRPGQTAEEARAERRAWLEAWGDRLYRLERDG